MTWTPVVAGHTQARLPQHVRGHGYVVLVWEQRAWEDKETAIWRPRRVHPRRWVLPTCCGH